MLVQGDSDLKAARTVLQHAERYRWTQTWCPFLVSWGPSCSAVGAQQVLTISGELDIATAPNLKEALRLASGAVLIDCQALQFIDASAIGVLVAALDHLDGIRLINAGPRIRRVITLVGLDRELLGDDG